MKNIYRKAILFMFILQSVYGNEIFQSVRVFNPSEQTLKIISETDIPLDHIVGKKGVYVDVIASEDQTLNLILKGLNVDILIPDLTSHYQSINIPADSRDFPLGSLQGNYSLDELNDRFDELQSEYSNIISERVILGQSIEGRDIWAFKVSDNPENDEDEPEVLFTALTHAREPVGMMNLIYFVQLLGEEYGNDPELTYLVDNREIWFLPVVNPDGYVYNESIQPSGGGMHRKNRRDTNCGNGTQRGIDLNRNYGYGWGANDTGSSPNPCSSTYRGQGAFSEPETQCVSDFILDREFKGVLHYHTYSNVYIHAYGNATLPDEPDLTTHREIGNEMARYNGYPVGTGYELIGYTVNGDAVDWTYGDQGIVAFTPEVGSPSQGFWPQENDVLPLCQDQVHPNKIFAFVAGSDLILYSFDLSQNAILPGDEFEIELAIQNRGLSDSNDEIVINVTPYNEWITLNLESYTMDELEARDTDEFLVSAIISETAPNGIYSGLIVSIDDGESFIRQDTVIFLIGEPDIIFYEGFENGLDNWELDGDWGPTNDAATGSFALTDSPSGNYQQSQETIAELSLYVDLTLLTIPMVTFTAKWDIESNWDFVRFQANVPGNGWISLEGLYTEAGVGQSAQPLGEPGYDGVQDDWVMETILLDQLGASSITGFRFIQTSDNYVEGDGFTVDDFTILGFPYGLVGDFDSDNYVGILDILGLADLILFGGEPTNIQLDNCDLNNDGNLDLMDLVELVNLVMGS
jgi:hypothetical protein